MGQTFIISNSLVEAFKSASSDTNPLHLDADYAKRTPFGRTVAYGMAAVLLALGRWAEGRKFKIRDVKGNFLRPLYPEVPYDLEIVEAENRATLLISKSGVKHHEYILNWADLEASASWPRSTTSGLIASTGSEYEIQSQGLDRLLKEAGLHPNQLPWEQLTTLLWSSFYVGMVNPGRSALYSEFKFQFVEGDKPTPRSCNYSISDKFDPRFKLHTIAGSGSGLEKFEIRAFRRPDPISISWTDVKNKSPLKDSMADHKAIVTGAGRGFGRALSLALAARGASVLMNVRGVDAEIASLVDEVRTGGGKIDVALGDLGRETDCESSAKAFASISGKVGTVVFNATPPIPTLGFTEQTQTEWEDFLLQSLRLVTNFGRYVLPLLSEGSKVLFISSVYLDKPKRGFTNYLAAKAAGEALLRGWAAEFPKLTFLTIRLPQMLTDQTNSPFSLGPAMRSPVDVANDVAEALARGWPRGFSEIAFPS